MWHTSVQGRKTIEGRVVLLNSLPEVVGSQAVLPQLVVHAPKVVEVEGSQTFTGVCGHGHVGCRAQYLHSLLVVTAKVLHVGLEEVGTGGLRGGERSSSGGGVYMDG